MFDWIGSLRLRERSDQRVVLSLSLATQVAGLVLLCAGLWGALRLWAISPWLAVLPGAVAAFGLLLVTLRRTLTFDREAGVLRVEQWIMGIATRSVVPLFHLRAVVIVARVARATAPARVFGLGAARYVAYIDRRVGDAIFLDESRRCATLLQMGEAIADVAELRLEYDAMSRAAGDE